MTAINEVGELARLIQSQLALPGTGWAIGAFGAIGEFMRDRLEPVTLGDDSAVTDRGGIRLRPTRDTVAIAHESLQGRDAWSAAITLCMPQALNAVSMPAVITELGPDHDALRESDQSAILFDMGLALGNVQACLRSTDPATVTMIRRFCGEPLLDHAAFELFQQLPVLSPHRVFLSAIGRVEVYQPIPPVNGKTPEGPHTHVLPKLLRARRTHAADVPIPDGWWPVATLYPANPLRDALGRRKPFARHEWDQWHSLFTRYASTSADAAKRTATDALARGEPLPLAESLTRAQRLTMRVAVRQWHAQQGAQADSRRDEDRQEQVPPVVEQWVEQQSGSSAQAHG